MSFWVDSSITSISIRSMFTLSLYSHLRVLKQHPSNIYHLSRPPLIDQDLCHIGCSRPLCICCVTSHLIVALHKRATLAGSKAFDPSRNLCPVVFLSLLIIVLIVTHDWYANGTDWFKGTPASTQYAETQRCCVRDGEKHRNLFFYYLYR